MPVPANTPELTLGRGWFDARKFRPDTDPAVIEALKLLAMTIGGAGAPGPAKSGDPVYMQVYAQPDGGGAHNLYGGNPADPPNPTPLVVSASGSATVDWKEEGALVLSSGTVNFVGANVTVTDVAGTATVTIVDTSGTVTEAFKTITITPAAGAAAQSDVVADLAADTLTLAEDFGIEIRTTPLSDVITFDFRNGDGLESDGGSPANVRVKAHTYIDVTSNGVAVDFTEVAHYNATKYQFLINDTGTFEWNTGVDGPGIVFDNGGNEFSIEADVHNASHVGLVDPTTGDDSIADDAQIGILWHEIENFADGRNQLHGHIADDPDKPKVTCKTTEDWLALLENYDSAGHQIIGNDPTKAGGEGAEKVRWLDAPQKVLWCIDPDGGHTITTSGTTLTLTLKVTKCTFDAVNFVSAVDADVTVTYTGTECP